MWLTGVYVALNNLLLLAIGLKIYFKNFFDACNFLPKKSFLSNLLTLVFYINFNH